MRSDEREEDTRAVADGVDVAVSDLEALLETWHPHDPEEEPWTGWWPDELECVWLGLTHVQVAGASCCDGKEDDDEED